jgi:hypothetical protein
MGFEVLRNCRWVTAAFESQLGIANVRPDHPGPYVENQLSPVSNGAVILTSESGLIYYPWKPAWMERAGPKRCQDERTAAANPGQLNRNQAEPPELIFP